MQDGINIAGNDDREVVFVHRQAISYIDRVYSLGMIFLIVLNGWRWLQGETTLYGIILLTAIATFSFVMTRLATRASDSRKMEPLRFLVLFFISPALLYYTDPGTAFLATYLFMGVGTCALIAMVGAKVMWVWLNLSLWALNLFFSFALLPNPDWHVCWVMATILFVLGPTFYGTTSTLRTAVLNATQRAEELRHSQAELARSAKFAALGEMAGGIAHEINTPLTIIHLKASQLMRLANQGTLNIDALRQVATTMESTARHIGTIVSSLRMFARQGKTTPFQEQDLAIIVGEAVRLSRERTSANEALLETYIPDIPLLVECRSVSITQVLVNLLNNALDAVASQSKMWVGLEVRDRDDKVEIRVSDSGPGVPHGKRAQLFQPFYSTKEIGKGTGLGLSISKGIIESHHGKLFLDSDTMHTTFVVVLPKRQPKEMPENEL